MTLHLRPSEIHFSQDSISCRFSISNKRIGETLDELCKDRISVSDIKRISVAYVKGQWFTWDNRRLWVFRHLERLGKCNTILVRRSSYIAHSRLTTKCGGHSVDVRGEPGGFWYKQASNSLSLPSARWSSARSHASGLNSVKAPPARSPPTSLPPANSTDSPSIIDTLWTVAEIGLGIGALLWMALRK